MELSEIVKQIDKAGSGFDSVIDEAQKRMLKEVINLTKDLKTSNGQILPSVENLKLISKIKGALTKAVVNKDYKAGVSDLIKSFDTIQAEQLNYLNSISNKAPELQKYKLVKEMAIDNTVSQLTESGIDANVTSKLKDMLTRAVTTNANYSDLLGEVREFLTDTDKSAGALSKYAKTYTNTALSQYVGQNNQLITEGSGAEWFRYVGSDIKTTREWCDKMTDKEWVHISEFPEILKGHIDGHKCEIYDKTKLPKGMIEGTTVANLAVNCGGWNCKHSMYPVMTLQVPKNLRDKFESVQKLKTEKETNNINNQKIEEALNIKKGKEMNFEEANELKGNINFGSAYSYSINCQSCVVSNELRRRGFDVTAKPNTGKGSIPYELSRATEKAWIDPITGKTPEKFYAGGKMEVDKRGRLVKKDLKNIANDINQYTKNEGRYTIEYIWKGTKSGHIISLERLPNGNIQIYDPQSGKKISWVNLSKQISTGYSVRLLRVDNLEVDTKIVNGIVKQL